MNMQILRFDDADDIQAPSRASRHQAETLTNGAATAEIALGDQVYCLRITRAGKLLLTK